MIQFELIVIPGAKIVIKMFKTNHKYDPSDPKIIKYGLTEDEYHAINMYTSDKFYKIPYNNLKNTNPDVVKQRKLLTKGILKLAMKQIPPDVVYANIDFQMPAVWKNDAFRSTSLRLLDLGGKNRVMYRKPPLGAFISEFSDYPSEDEYLILPGHTVVVKDYYYGVYTVDTYEESDIDIDSLRNSSVRRVSSPDLGDWKGVWEYVNPSTFTLDISDGGSLLNNVNSFGYNKLMMTLDLSLLDGIGKEDKRQILDMKTKDGDNLLTIAIKDGYTDQVDILLPLYSKDIRDGWGRTIDMNMAIYYGEDYDEPIKDDELIHKDIFGRSLLFYSGRPYGGDYDSHTDIYGSTPLHYFFRNGISPTDTMWLGSSKTFRSPIDGSTYLSSIIQPGSKKWHKKHLIKYLTRDVISLRDVYGVGVFDLSSLISDYMNFAFGNSKYREEYKSKYNLGENEMVQLADVVIMRKNIEIKEILEKISSRQIQKDIIYLDDYNNIINYGIFSGKVNSIVGGKYVDLWDFPGYEVLIILPGEYNKIRRGVYSGLILTKIRGREILSLEEMLKIQSRSRLINEIKIISSEGENVLIKSLYDGEIKLFNHLLKYMTYADIIKYTHPDIYGRTVQMVFALTGMRPNLPSDDKQLMKSNKKDIFGRTASFYANIEPASVDDQGLTYDRWSVINGHSINVPQNSNFKQIARDGTSIVTSFVPFLEDPPNDMILFTDDHKNTWWHAAAWNGLYPPPDVINLKNKYGMTPLDYYNIF